jgi:hypothetical protein
MIDLWLGFENINLWKQSSFNKTGGILRKNTASTDSYPAE